MECPILQELTISGVQFSEISFLLNSLVTPHLKQLEIHAERCYENNLPLVNFLLECPIISERLSHADRLIIQNKKVGEVIFETPSVCPPFKSNTKLAFLPVKPWEDWFDIFISYISRLRTLSIGVCLFRLALEGNTLPCIKVLTIESQNPFPDLSRLLFDQSLPSLEEIVLPSLITSLDRSQSVLLAALLGNAQNPKISIPMTSNEDAYIHLHEFCSDVGITLEKVTL